MTETDLMEAARELKRIVRDEPGDPQNKVVATLAIDVGLMVILDLHRAADALETLAGNSAELDRYRKFYGSLPR